MFKSKFFQSQSSLTQMKDESYNIKKVVRFSENPSSVHYFDRVENELYEFSDEEFIPNASIQQERKRVIIKPKYKLQPEQRDYWTRRAEKLESNPEYQKLKEIIRRSKETNEEEKDLGDSDSNKLPVLFQESEIIPQPLVIIDKDSEVLQVSSPKQDEVNSALRYTSPDSDILDDLKTDDDEAEDENEWGDESDEIKSEAGEDFTSLEAVSGYYSEEENPSAVEYSSLIGTGVLANDTIIFADYAHNGDSEEEDVFNGHIYHGQELDDSILDELYSTLGINYAADFYDADSEEAQSSEEDGSYDIEREHEIKSKQYKGDFQDQNLEDLNKPDMGFAAACYRAILSSKMLEAKGAFSRALRRPAEVEEPSDKYEIPSAAESDQENEEQNECYQARPSAPLPWEHEELCDQFGNINIDQDSILAGESLD